MIDDVIIIPLVLETAPVVAAADPTLIVTTTLCTALTTVGLIKGVEYFQRKIKKD